MPPARTGKDNTSKNLVTTTLHTKREAPPSTTPYARLLPKVHKKLIPPRIELAPARCNAKIIRSTAPDLWPRPLLRGG
jgi:hypothetical protein